MKMLREIETLVDHLCEPGRREGRRAPVIYATWQCSPGLNIPGERMENEPPIWEPLCRELREEPL